MHWPSLWRVFSQQGINDHMIKFLHNLYKDQTRQIAGTNESSRLLSPRVFCAVLEMAMGMWRRTVGGLGFDLGDGGPTLLDLRFADDGLDFCCHVHWRWCVYTRSGSYWTQEKPLWWLQWLSRHHFCQPQLVYKSNFLTNNHVINSLAACWICRQ